MNGKSRKNKKKKRKKKGKIKNQLKKPLCLQEISL